MRKQPLWVSGLVPASNELQSVKPRQWPAASNSEQLSDVVEKTMTNGKGMKTKQNYIFALMFRSVFHEFSTVSGGTRRKKRPNKTKQPRFCGRCTPPYPWSV